MPDFEDRLNKPQRIKLEALAQAVEYAKMQGEKWGADDLIAYAREFEAFICESKEDNQNKLPSQKDFRRTRRLAQ